MLPRGQLKLGGLSLRAFDKNYVLMLVDAEGEHPYSVWPRSASDRAMGTRRIGKPRSFTDNMVNQNFAIEPLPRIVYVYSQSSYSQTSACVSAFWGVYSGARIPRGLYSVGLLGVKLEIPVRDSELYQ